MKVSGRAFFANMEVPEREDVWRLLLGVDFEIFLLVGFTDQSIPNHHCSCIASRNIRHSTKNFYAHEVLQRPYAAVAYDPEEASSRSW